MSVDLDPRLAGLGEIVGVDNLLVGEAARPFATDVYRHLEMPSAVVRPATVEALQAVVKQAAALEMKIAVRGGGASYTDGYLARDADTLLIDLSRLDKITEINEVDAYVTVEAGVTWAALRTALAERDLRTPFWGPFSGLVATVGGSVSQNTTSHGSGAYGISAQSIQALDVVLANGSLLRTGSGARGAAPFARHFGPDLTGLFTGDCGAFGIKARITLPLLRRRTAHRSVSFAFPDFPSMHTAMRLVGLERLEDSHFALDAALSQGQIARQDRIGGSLAMAGQILRSSPSLTAGLMEILRAAAFARKALTGAAFMVHYIAEGVDAGEAKSRAHRIRQICAPLGREIPATVPAVVRGMPFAPLYNVLGPGGERWVPLHGVIAHSAAPAFHEALGAFYAARADEMKRLGVWTGGMFATVGSSSFLYEIAIYWPDTISAYHATVVDPAYLASLPQHAENTEARAYVHTLKSELTALFSKHDAISFQLGKTYPYLETLQPAPRGLIEAIKRFVDPQARLAPGNLGL